MSKYFLKLLVFSIFPTNPNRCLMDYSNLEEENKRLKAELNKHDSKKKEKWAKRARLTKKISASFLGTNLKKAITNFFTELEEKRSVSKNTVSDLLTALFMRITRIGVFLILTSFLPTLFLLIQVYYLRNQNELITGQNERLGQQTNLQEADRRSSMLFVLDQMIKDVTTDGYRNNGKISKANSTRIIAMSKILKPYRYLDKDTLISKPVSPERGYLLMSMLESNIDLDKMIDQNTKQTLSSLLNFEYAELTNASITDINLKNLHLNFAKMNGSNFMKSYIHKSELNNASLRNTNFSRTDIIESSFVGSDLNKANFKGASLKIVDFENANLSNVNFEGADLIQINFKNATILNAKFDNANVTPDWMNIQEEKLDNDNFDYLEDHYKIKVHNKKGILIAK